MNDRGWLWAVLFLLIDKICLLLFLCPQDLHSQIFQGTDWHEPNGTKASVFVIVILFLLKHVYPCNDVTMYQDQLWNYTNSAFPYRIHTDILWHEYWSGNWHHISIPTLRTFEEYYFLFWFPAIQQTSGRCNFLQPTTLLLNNLHFWVFTECDFITIWHIHHEGQIIRLPYCRWHF